MSVLQRCLKKAPNNSVPQALPQQLLHAVDRAWHLKGSLLSDLWALALVPVLFAAFVVWNGGIVLGDKAAHAPVVHLMQPLYFVLFTAVALGPFHFSPVRWVVHADAPQCHGRAFVGWTLASALSALCISMSCCGRCLSHATTSKPCRQQCSLL